MVRDPTMPPYSSQTLSGWCCDRQDSSASVKSSNPREMLPDTLTNLWLNCSGVDVNSQTVAVTTRSPQPTSGMTSNTGSMSRRVSQFMESLNAPTSIWPDPAYFSTARARMHNWYYSL